MGPSSDVRPGRRIVAAVLCGLLCSTSVAPTVFAQNKPGTTKAPPKAPPPNKPVAPPAAKPAAKPAIPLNDAQKKALAKKSYEDGKKKLEAKDYTGALESFKTANETLPSPAAQHKIAICLDELGRTSEAIAAYETFVSQANPDKMQAQIDESKARLNVLKSMPMPAKVVTVPQGATVSVDGAQQMGMTPLELKIAPGKHKVTVSVAGYDPAEQEIEVKPGEKVADLSFTLNKKTETVPVGGPPTVAPPPTSGPPVAPPPPVDEKPRSNMPAYITLGIAGAGAVVGTIFGVMALGKKSDFDKTPTTDLADKTERNALIADMAFGVAVTLGVTGTVLLLSNKSSDGPPKAGLKLDKPNRTMHVAPYMNPHGGGAAAVWTF